MSSAPREQPLQPGQEPVLDVAGAAVLTALTMSPTPMPQFYTRASMVQMVQKMPVLGQAHGFYWRLGVGARPVRAPLVSAPHLVTFP